MNSSTLLRRLAAKEITAEALAAKIIRTPDLLPTVLEGLRAEAARVKYGCLKSLRLVAEKRPDILQPHFDLFAGLLDSDATIFRWGAAGILADLAAADSGHRFDAIREKYFAPITGPDMIMAANVMRGSARIAAARPDMADWIARRILKVEDAVYGTPECRNVAIGHAIKAFQELFPGLKARRPVLDFMARQAANSRRAVGLAAQRFLKTQAARGLKHRH